MENINDVFAQMMKGEIEGRIVLDIATPDNKGGRKEEKKNKAVKFTAVGKDDHGPKF